MSVARIDLNGDQRMDWVSWRMECDEEHCEPLDVEVRIAVALENSSRSRLIPIEELESLRYYQHIIHLEDFVERRRHDIDRIVYAFSFRLEKREPVFPDEVLRWGLQLCLKVKPSENLDDRKNSLRGLGAAVFHPDLFRLPRR